MGIISTIAGAIGGKVVDHFTGNIGNKVIETVNGFLEPNDKLSKETSPEEFMETYYGKLSQEERLQVNTRFAELENEAEKINVELQKVMAESDKVNGSYRKWVALIMALTIVGTTIVYTYLIYTYVTATEEWPSTEIVVGIYAIPSVILLLSFGLSGRTIKELIILLKPREKSTTEKTVDKVVNTINKKK